MVWWNLRGFGKAPHLRSWRENPVLLGCHDQPDLCNFHTAKSIHVLGYYCEIMVVSQNNIPFLIFVSHLEKPGQHQSVSLIMRRYVLYCIETETNYTHLSTAQSRVPPYPKLILAVIMISLSTVLIMEVIMLINLITIITTAFTHLIDNELLLCMFLSKGCDFSPQGAVLSFHNVQLFAHTVLCVFQIFDIHENLSHLCRL